MVIFTVLFAHYVHNIVIMNIFFLFFKEIKFYHFRLRKCLKDKIDGFSAIIITSLLTLMVLKFIGFCILELLKSCHEIETRMESFLELCGKVVKIRLGSFMELQLGNVFRLIKVWNFLCVFIVYELLETNLNFFTRSTINLLFLDWGTGLKSAYIKVSVVFRKCIQTRFDQLDIEIILLQDPEKVQRDVKLKVSEAVSLSYERFEDLRRYEIFKV